MKKKVTMFLSMIFLSATLVSCDFNFDTTSNSGGQSNQTVKYDITYSQALLYKNSIDTVWVNAIAEVENTGTTDLYLSTGSMDLEKEDGSLVKVLSYVSVYPQIISPGEKAYYYETTTLDNVSESTKLNVVLHADAVKSKKDKLRFPTTDVALQDEQYFGIKAIGKVENTSDKDESMLYVAVALFDSSSKPLAVLTTIPDVKAGQKVGFSASGLGVAPSITTSVVKSFETWAYPYQYQF